MRSTYRRPVSAIALALSVLVGFVTPIGDAAAAFASVRVDEEPPASTVSGESSGADDPVNADTDPETAAPDTGEHDGNDDSAVDDAEAGDTEADLGDATLDSLALDVEALNEDSIDAGELSASQESPIAPRSAMVSPFAAGDSTTPNAYFSLRQQGTPGGSGDDRGTISAIIDKFVVNPTGPALSPTTSQSALVPLEGDRPPDQMNASPGNNVTNVQYRVRQSDYNSNGFNANALGVASDGNAYFTVQFYPEQRQQSSVCSTVIFLGFCVLGTWSFGSWGAWSTPGTSAVRYLSVWQVNLETGIVSKLVERSTILDSSAATITGGSVNSAGMYFFSYVTSQTSPNNSMRFFIYRLNGTAVELSSTATTVVNSGLNTSGTLRGDIAFDGYGNLHMLVGGTGAVSRMARLTSAQVPGSGSVSPTGITVTTINQSTPPAGAQPAGIAFPFSSYTVWQGADTHFLRNMTSLDSIVSTQAHGSVTGQRDLASIVRTPQFQLRLEVVGGLQKPGDRFTLSATPGTSAMTRNTPSGTTSYELADDWITVTRALSSNNLTTTAIPFSVTAMAGTATLLSDYTQQWNCIETNSNTQSGAGTTASGAVSVTVIGNPQMRCTVTLTRSAPNLIVTKQAFTGAIELAKGVLLNEQDEVTYRLTFDNESGTAAATGIDYTDHLADVLDDATFVTGSLTLNPSASGLTVSGVNGSGALTSDTMKITGSVPPGQTHTVSFRVRVKQNTEDAVIRNPAPLLPPSTSVPSSFYELNNYLVEGSAVPPTSCAELSTLCTSNPVVAWSMTKLSQPGSGASMNPGGTPNYTIVVEKSDTAMSLEGVQVVDDLTEVLKFAEWDANIVPPQPALPRGIYFYDENLTMVGSIDANNLPPGTTLDDWIPAPTYNNAAETWTLTTAVFNLPANAKYAHVRFSVRLGTPQAAPPGSTTWNPANPPEPDTPFTNVAVTTADSNGLAPNQCWVDTPPSQLPDTCKATHRINAVLAFRKDAVGLDASGTRTTLTDLVGHEFEIYQADPVTGEITDDLPSNACVNWNHPTATDPSDPPSCWRFYPIQSGSQIGRWRSHNLLAGDYWLVETKAPDQQNIGGVLHPISGVQLLAEPIPFRVASVADAAGDPPIVGGQPTYLRAGQMDVFSSTTAASGPVLDRCDTTPPWWPSHTACVNPTGFLMIISDVKLGPLPLAGGPGAIALTVGGVVLLLAAFGGIWWWRRSQHHPAEKAPTGGGDAS